MNHNEEFYSGLHNGKKIIVSEILLLAFRQEHNSLHQLCLGLMHMQSAQTSAMWLTSNWPWHFSSCFLPGKHFGCENGFCQQLMYWLIRSLHGQEFPDSYRARIVALLRDTSERMFWKRLTFSSAVILQLRGLFSAAASSVSKSDNIQLYTVLNQLNCCFPVFSYRKVHINNFSQ